MDKRKKDVTSIVGFFGAVSLMEHNSSWIQGDLL